MFSVSPKPWRVEEWEHENGASRGYAVLDANGDEVCILFVNEGSHLERFDNDAANAFAIVCAVNGNV